jgi:hypothetical protein
MKKIAILLFLSIIFLSACSTQEVSEPQEIVPEVELNEEEKSDEGKVSEVINDIKFNSNLNEYEIQWLTYLDNKYLYSKIYHIKTKNINCDNCYEVSYKKDRQIITIKVMDNEKVSEKTVVDDLVVDIENENVCSLFQGTWNECPKLCDTDEEACQTQCGLPACEFDEDKIILKELGEICGGLNLGDCVYGLSCKYKNKDDDSGICVE